MKLKLSALVLALSGWVAECQASLLWSIDQNNSYIQLNIPDQTVPINNNDPPDTINAMLRDYQVNGGPVNTGDPDEPLNWTGPGGRRSEVSGAINTNYSEGTSVQFLGGTHSAEAVEFGAFRPDLVDPPGTGPAAFAGDVWGFEESDPDNFPGVITYARIGHVRIRNIDYDMDGTASLTEGPIGTWTQSGGSIDMGILSGAVVDVDLAGLLTQFGLVLDPFSDVNQGTVLVENIGGLNRRMTITVDVPLTFDLQGIGLSASITGEIVAYASVPEPASLALMSLGLVGAVNFRRRRK